MANEEVVRFEDVPERVLWTMIYVNIAAATFLTHLVIPSMKRLNKGAIINISSGSEIASVPYFAIYSATKV